MLSKIKQKYNSLPSPARAALWFTICSILQRGVQFIVVPIYTRVLSAAEYGIYSVFMSWTEILQIFCTLNLFYNSYNVGLTKFDKDKDRYSSSMLGLCTAITVLFTAVYCAFYQRFDAFFGMPTLCCAMAFLHLAVRSPYLLWMARERYEYRYKAVLAGTVILSVAVPVLALAFLPLFEDNSNAVIISKVVIEVLLGIPAVIIILRSGRTLFDKFYWKYGLVNNIPLVPYYLSQIILNHSDRLMINSLCDTGKAGTYSVAYSAAMLLTVINTAINNSVIPWKFKKLKKKDTAGIHSVTFSLMGIVMAMNAVLIALAPEAMKILASPEYYEAVWIVPPVACSAYLIFCSQQFINIEFYFEENNYASVSSIVVAVLNIGLNYVCISKFGYIAAGYTTLFCYIVFFVFHYAAMRFVCRKHMDNEKIWKIRPIILMTLLFISFSAVMLMCYNGFAVRYIIVACIAAAAFIKRKTIIRLLKIKNM